MKTMTIDFFKEIRLGLAIFCFCNLLNVISIIAYKTAWKELWTQLWIVCGLSLLLYLCVFAIRVIVHLIHSRKNNAQERTGSR
jgi:cell shape-determining protein MreD